MTQETEKTPITDDAYHARIIHASKRPPESDKSAMIEHVITQPPSAIQVSRAIERAANAMEESLSILVNEKVDYMRRNRLGNPDIQFTVVWAREALAAFAALRKEER